MTRGARTKMPSVPMNRWDVFPDIVTVPYAVRYPAAAVVSPTVVVPAVEGFVVALGVAVGVRVTVVSPALLNRVLRASASA